MPWDYATDLGMLGTGRWDDWDPETESYTGKPGTIRPENWNDRLLLEYPNGDVTLTAMTAKMKKKVATDPVIHWKGFRMPSHQGTVTAVYTDAAMTALYAGGGVSDQSLYIHIDAEIASQIRPGHQVTLIQDPGVGVTPDWELSANAKVQEVVPNGANSYCRVRLIKDDVTTTLGNHLGDANMMVITGDIHPEGSPWPEGHIYSPKRYTNFHQIFKEPWTITGTQQATKIRGQFTAEQFQQMTAFHNHAVQKERCFLFGQRSIKVGDNGQDERTMDGIIEVLKNNGGTVSDFRNAADVGITYASGAGSWEASGEDWFSMQAQKFTTYKGDGLKPGNNTGYLCLCGRQWLYHFNRLVKKTNGYDLEKGVAKYGIKVNTYLSVWGDFHFVTHPLFVGPFAYSCLIIDPNDLIYVHLKDRDTKLLTDRNLKDKSSRHDWIDGFTNGYLCECSLEFHYPFKGAWLHGCGIDRP